MNQQVSMPSLQTNLGLTPTVISDGQMLQTQQIVVNGVTPSNQVNSDNIDYR